MGDNNTSSNLQTFYNEIEQDIQLLQKQFNNIKSSLTNNNNHLNYSFIDDTAFNLKKLAQHAEQQKAEKYLKVLFALYGRLSIASNTIDRFINSLSVLNDYDILIKLNKLLSKIANKAAQLNLTESYQYYEQLVKSQKDIQPIITQSTLEYQKGIFNSEFENKAPRSDTKELLKQLRELEASVSSLTSKSLYEAIKQSAQAKLIMINMVLESQFADQMNNLRG